MTSPTQLSLKYLRQRGYRAEVVERWVKAPGILDAKGRPMEAFRRDLFKCIDVLAVKRGVPGALGVQCCVIGDVANRLEKAKQQPGLEDWLLAHNLFQVFGWVIRGAVWEVKIAEVKADQCDPVIVRKPRRRTPVRHVQGELF